MKIPRRRAGSAATRHTTRGPVAARLRGIGTTIRGAVGRFDIKKRDHAAALVLAIALVIGSAIALASLLGGAGKPVALPPTPPSPSPSVTTSTAAVAPPTKARSKPARKRPAFVCPKVRATGGGDAPQEICIPSLGVATSVLRLGLNSDNTVQVPTLAQVREAGWYKYSAAPGAVGPTVILGHVDSAQYGEGIFYQLSKLHAGDEVRVQRGDGKVAVFRINSVVQVSKQHFPTNAVYGPTSGPALRLVTCGGTFDAATGNYLDNIIAYGTLLQMKNL